MLQPKPGPARRAAEETDPDPDETREWLDSIEDLLYRWGPDRVRAMLARLEERARLRHVELPFDPATPQVNTIPAERQGPYPGDVALEEKIEAACRWNAVATVIRANARHAGLGGHLSTYASNATLYEVGFNHFFRGADGADGGDQVFIQGHGSPGIYSRSALEGRLTLEQLANFRQELAPGGGLPSYPHPWLMPDYWQFPTVSMGLGPLQAVYQARFNRYLAARGLADTARCRVWAFLGDGETDEPEAKGAIDIAAREGLDNLTFVINCNLQRLDGPVRGNHSIVRELEGFFRGAGWRVIKVMWGGAWDELFAKDEDGLLAAALGALVDGQLQRLSAGGPKALREELFGQSPELARLIDGWSDDDLRRLVRGGHDREKVFAAFAEACRGDGRPTAILAHTVKGWKLGAAVQATNSTHQQKKLKADALVELKDRLGLALSDDEAREAAFYAPPADAPEVRYLRERRAALDGPLPARAFRAEPIDAPPLESLADLLTGSGGREASTTMAFVRVLAQLLRDEAIGKLCVPIVADEARTFGMEAFFRQVGIYAPGGQKYEPVDRKTMLYYRELPDGQLLEEGITEAGGTASFVAAGTAHLTHGVNTIPFFLTYSMFGFQRVGDLLWAAGDMGCRGFFLGATAGRTTLNGEGLQHQDGHSHLMASAFPHVRAYDPAYGYEITILVQDGLRRMLREQEPVLYYLTLQNDNYVQPALPEGDGVAEGVINGLYRLRAGDGDGPRVQLFGSGSILPHVLQAADLLAERFGVAADVWSATSYKQLRTDAMVADRWNRLHPTDAPRTCHLWDRLAGVEGPFVAASDYVALVAEQIAPWVPGRLWALGTDGFGRSDTRERLRRHFEVDAESVAFMALHALAAEGKFDPAAVAAAIGDLGLDPEAPDSLLA